MTDMEGGAIESTAEPQPAEYALAPELPAPAVPAPAPSRPNQFGQRLAASIVVAIIVATAGGIGVGWELARLINNHTTAATPIQAVSPVIQGGTNRGSGTLSTGAIAAKLDPAIVDVNTVIQTTSGTSRAAGTGLIISSSGDVLTNNHVVAGSISINVTIQGRSGTYTADVIGVDPTADLAVIRIEGVSGLKTVALADSSSLQVGDAVVAIGNALGLGGAPRVTEGAITALDQTITASENGANSEQLTGMIQSDAEISPGDSGGALANSAGQVVGIITAGEAQGFRTQSSTVAYSIPSSTAVTVANEILSGQASAEIILGKVGFLGVRVQAFDPNTAAQLGLSVTSGALVVGVQAGSPAELAGIAPDAVITNVAGTPIDSPATLGNTLHAYKPGAQVKVTWVDQKGSHSVTVTLIEGPAV